MRAELAKEGKTSLGVVLYSERPDEKEYLAGLLRDGIIVQATEEAGTLILLPAVAPDTGAGDEEGREPAGSPQLDTGNFIG